MHSLCRMHVQWLHIPSLPLPLLGMVWRTEALCVKQLRYLPMFLLMGGVVCRLSGTLVFPVKLFRLLLGGIAILFSRGTRSVTVHLELEFHAAWSRSQRSFCRITMRWVQGCPWRLSPQHWEGAVAVLSSFCVGSPLFAWLRLGTFYTHDHLFWLLFIFQQILGILCHFSDRHTAYLAEVLIGILH